MAAFTPTAVAGLQIFLSEVSDDETSNIMNVCNGTLKTLSLLLETQINSRKQRRIITPTRIEGYIENVIPRYLDDDFKSHFRMYRTTFAVLLEMLAQVDNKRNSTVISLEKKCMMTIWLLANQESFRGVSDRFGVSKGTLHYIFQEVATYISNLDELFKWPDQYFSSEIACKFQNKYKFPGVIGAIDGCHIPIKAPVKDQESYYNRKHFHSVILQAVCDYSMIFTDVYIGWPGSVHDARVFRNSPVKKCLKNLSSEHHLLGDSAYPLETYLLTPYRDNGHLTDMQRNYNIILSSARSVIERSFAHLVGKFRRLKYLDMSNVSMIPIVIKCACVLHNLILINEKSELEKNYESLKEDYFIRNSFTGETSSAANLKRNSIAASL